MSNILSLLWCSVIYQPFHWSYYLSALFHGPYLLLLSVFSVLCHVLFVWMCTCCVRQSKDAACCWIAPPSPGSPSLHYFFSSGLPLFHSSRSALHLSIRVGAALEQRSNLDLPPQSSSPSPAPTLGAHCPILSRLRQEILHRFCPLFRFCFSFFYQRPAVLY